MCIRLCLRPNLAELFLFDDFVAEAHFSCLPRRFVRCRQVHGATQWSHLRDLTSLQSLKPLYVDGKYFLKQHSESLAEAHLIPNVKPKSRRDLVVQCINAQSECKKNVVQLIRVVLKQHGYEFVNYISFLGCPYLNL